MNPFPEDMDKVLQSVLFMDMLMFGNAYYEKGEQGYKRIDPREIEVTHEQ